MTNVRDRVSPSGQFIGKGTLGSVRQVAFTEAPAAKLTADGEWQSIAEWKVELAGCAAGNRLLAFGTMPVSLTFARAAEGADADAGFEFLARLRLTTTSGTSAGQQAAIRNDLTPPAAIRNNAVDAPANDVDFGGLEVYASHTLAGDEAGAVSVAMHYKITDPFGLTWEIDPEENGGTIVLAELFTGA